MNLLHRWLCSSNRWKGIVRERIVPWVVEGIDLGQDVLEMGAGPGAATDCIRPLTHQLTCIEIDPGSAARLRERMATHGVRVLCEDATATSLQDESFDAALCFSMLHHLPSAALQDRLFREAGRVLRPGGVFAGFDVCDSASTRLIHAFDTMVPLPPPSLPDRLRAAGFTDVETDVRAIGLRFRARRGPLVG